MRAYCDGSGDKGTDFLVLTGVAASDHVWAGFEAQWKRILDNRTPKASCVHTCDMMALSEDFEREKGWDEKKASQLLWDCLLYAQRLDKEDFRVFTCTVDMAYHRQLKADGAKIPTAYQICSRFCPEMILKWYLGEFSKNFVQGKLNYYFDRGERHLGVFERRRRAGEKAGRTHGLHLLTYWDVIETAIPVNMRNFYPIQLADIISWAHTRRLMRGKYGEDVSETWTELYKVAETVLPFKRAEIDKNALDLIAHFGGLIPEHLDEEFGIL